MQVNNAGMAASGDLQDSLLVGMSQTRPCLPVPHGKTSILRVHYQTSDIASMHRRCGALGAYDHTQPDHSDAADKVLSVTFLLFHSDLTA